MVLELFLIFISGLIIGKSIMYILMKIYYNRLLGDRRVKGNDRRKNGK